MKTTAAVLMILPHLYRVTANAQRTNQYSMIKKTSERQSASASVLRCHAITLVLSYYAVCF